jgi:hypothetical protein
MNANLLLIIAVGCCGYPCSLCAALEQFRSAVNDKCLAFTSPTWPSFYWPTGNNLRPCNFDRSTVSTDKFLWYPWYDEAKMIEGQVSGLPNRCLQADQAQEGKGFSWLPCDTSSALQRFTWTSDGYLMLGGANYKDWLLCLGYENNKMIVSKCGPGAPATNIWTDRNGGKPEVTAPPTPPTSAPIAPIAPTQSLDTLACHKTTKTIMIGIDELMISNAQQQDNEEQDADESSNALRGLVEETEEPSTISSFTIAGQQYVIDDFSNNQAHLVEYKTACKSKNGQYLQLSYEALCSNGAKTVKIVVSEQPKCYAPECKPDDFESLFQYYTLEPTQARATTELGGTWTCEGAIKTEGISACELETLLINSQSGEFVVKSSLDFHPKVTGKKFLFIFDVAEKAVDFTDSAILESVCVEIGGTLDFYAEKKDNMVKIKCKDPGDEDGSESAFEVKGLSACLGGSCEQSGEAFAHSAMALAFKEKMVEQEALGDNGANVVCTITSGGVVTQASLTITAVVWVSMVWCLF